MSYISFFTQGSKSRLPVSSLYVFHFKMILAPDWIFFFNRRYLLDGAAASGIEQSGLFLKLCKQISPS